MPPLLSFWARSCAGTERERGMDVKRTDRWASAALAQAGGGGLQDAVDSCLITDRQQFEAVGNGGLLLWCSAEEH